MVVGKTTIDNSVRYNPITEKTKEKETKPKTKKTSSLPRKQINKSIPQNNQKFTKNVIASGFGYVAK